MASKKVGRSSSRCAFVYQPSTRRGWHYPDWSGLPRRRWTLEPGAVSSGDEAQPDKTSVSETGCANVLPGAFPAMNVNVRTETMAASTEILLSIPSSFPGVRRHIEGSC